MTKTAEGLVKHCYDALEVGVWYVWGTWGQVLTKALLDFKVKQYPTRNTYAAHTPHIGEFVSDCVGLIKGYCWYQGGDYQYDASTDYNTSMAKNASKKVYRIKDMPEMPGLVVYQPGHVGVYVGDGWVIECAGGKGVIKTRLSDGRWTHAFEYPGIKYRRQSFQNLLRPTLQKKKGALVRISPTCYKYYDGQKMPEFVKSLVYEISELRGDRAVLVTDEDVVLGAVNVKDLILHKE